MNELQRISKVRQDLERATSVEEVKDIRNLAEAAREYAKQVGLGLEAQNECAEIKIRAERKGGMLLKEMGFGEHGGDRKSSSIVQLDDIGVSKFQSHRWQREASIPDDIFEEYVAEIKSKPDELTSAGVIRLARQLLRTNIEQQSFESKYPPIIYNLSYEKFLAKFDNHSIDLLLTDPPYMTDVDNIYQFAHWVDLALPKVKPTGRAYICIGAYPQELEAYLTILNSQTEMIFANVLVWTYRNTLGPQPKLDYKLNWQAILYLYGKDAPDLNCPLMVEQFAVQDINAPDGRTSIRYHAWQKPDELGERLIKHSTKVDDLVVDCFAGTGSFVIAAAKLGRNGQGCDIDNVILDIASQRGCVIREL